MYTPVIFVFALVALTSATPSLIGSIGLSPIGLGAPIAYGVAPGIIAPAISPIAIAPGIAPVVGAAAITNGGGSVAVSNHGAAIRGPPTAPVTIEGPSGTVRASGLWGPTLAGVLGH